MIQAAVFPDVFLISVVGPLDQDAITLFLTVDRDGRAVAHPDAGKQVLGNLFEAKILAGVFLFILPKEHAVFIEGESGLAVVIKGFGSGFFTVLSVSDLAAGTEGHRNSRPVFRIIIAAVFPQVLIEGAAGPADHDAVTFLFPEKLSGCAVGLPGSGKEIRIGGGLRHGLFLRFRQSDARHAEGKHQRHQNRQQFLHYQFTSLT